MTLFKISIPGRYREALVHVRSSFSAKRWQWLIGILAFLLVNSYIAVSYTHLDVYKRQEIEIILTMNIFLN